MRILIVSTQFPLPARDGASLRVLNLLRELSRRHEVVFCSLIDPAQAGEVEALRRVCAAVHVVPHGRPPLTKLRQMAEAPFRREPYLATIHHSDALQDLVLRLGRDADVAQGEFPYGARYILPLACRKVMDCHNVEADILRLQARHGRNPLRRLHAALQARKMDRFERAVCAQVDAVLATSEGDRRTLGRDNPQAHVVQNGVEWPEAAVGGASAEGGGTVTFTGLMSYPANVDAMAWFCREVWPEIRGGGRRLVIVGRNPHRDVLRLAAADVVVTGEVPDVRAYLSGTTAFVAPLRIGSGTRIKILEAMAHGLPVVSTSVGCLGLDAADGEEILVADTAAGLAERTDRLLRDRGLRERIALAGRRLVARRYTWPMIGEALQGVYARWA